MMSFILSNIIEPSIPRVKTHVKQVSKKRLQVTQQDPLDEEETIWDPSGIDMDLIHDIAPKFQS